MCRSHLTLPLAPYGSPPVSCHPPRGRRGQMPAGGRLPVSVAPSPLPPLRHARRRHPRGLGHATPKGLRQLAGIISRARHRANWPPDPVTLSNWPTPAHDIWQLATPSSRDRQGGRRRRRLGLVGPVEGLRPRLSRCRLRGLAPFKAPPPLRFRPKVPPSPPPPARRRPAKSHPSANWASRPFTALPSPALGGFRRSPSDPSLGPEGARRVPPRPGS